MLTLSTTIGQCVDLPKDDQNLEVITKKLATRLNVAYPLRQDEVYRRDAYYLLNNKETEKVVDDFECEIQDGRFKIALGILKDLYSKERLREDLKQSQQTDPIEECKKRLMLALTSEEIIKGNKNQKTIDVVINVAQNIPSLTQGIITVWEIIELLKKEISDQAAVIKSTEDPVRSDPQVNDEMQEIAFTLCFANLQSSPMLKSETPDDRIISLCSETGIDFKIMQKAFDKALAQAPVQSLPDLPRIVELHPEFSNIMASQVAEFQRVANLEIECGRLLSERLSTNELNDPEACELAIAIIISINPDLPEPLLRKVLHDIKEGKVNEMNEYMSDNIDIPLPIPDMQYSDD